MTAPAINTSILEALDEAWRCELHWGLRIGDNPQCENAAEWIGDVHTSDKCWNSMLLCEKCITRLRGTSWDCLTEGITIHGADGLRNLTRIMK